MKRIPPYRVILAFAVILTLSACTFSTATPGTDHVQTAVAATIQALTPGATSATDEAHALPSPTPSPAPVNVRVSFVDSAGNLYVWTEGTAAPVLLVNSGDVNDSDISFDGSTIVYTRSSDYTLYEVDSIQWDGSNPHTIFTAAQLQALPHAEGSITLAPNKIEWIGTTHHFALSLREIFEGPGLSINDTLYQVDADSGTSSSLLTVSDGFNFSFSPDGAWLAITRPTGIDLYTAAGSLIAADVVHHDFVNTASEYAWTASPVWQPDSSGFVVAVPPADPWSDSPANSAIWSVTTEGTATQLYSGQMSYFPAQIASFALPVGEMAYANQIGAPTDNNWALYIGQTNGAGIHEIDNGYFSLLPIWSTDGQNFVYAKLVGSARQAYLVQANSAPAQIADISSLNQVHWLDNTRFIAASTSDSGGSLLLETPGSSTGVIYNDAGSRPGFPLMFDVSGH